MATSRHNRTNTPEDNGESDAVIAPKTATPSARNIPLTPPRNPRVFGLVTPLTTPDSRSRPSSFESLFTSPPRTPVRFGDLALSGWFSKEATAIPSLPSTGLLTPEHTPLRISKPRPVPIGHGEKTKDKLESIFSLATTTVVEIPETEESTAIASLPLTGLKTPESTPPRISKPRPVPIGHREETKDKPESTRPHATTSTVVEIPETEESTAIPSLPPAGLKTPESTPARISKLRLIPIGHREETKDKPKSSPSLAAISTVAEIPETSEHRLEDIQCKGRPKELKILCNGITVKDKRACTKTVEALHVGQDTGSPLSTLSAVVRSPQRRQSQDAAAKQKPTTPISTTRKSVQCSAQAKSTGLRCRRRIAVTPGTGQLAKDSFQPIYCSSHSTSTALPTPVPSRIHFDPNKVFKVPRLGEDIYVRFCDYIPEYLQPDTQRKLRVAITKKISETDRKPGYVYALNVDDPENKGKLSLKIGYSNNVKKRYAEWKSQCRYMKDIRGWWPETIIKVEDDVEVLMQKLIVGHNTQGNVGPMAAQLERLVHIELKDLVAYAPYLDPNFPDVRPSGAPGFLAKAVPTRKPKIQVEKHHKHTRKYFYSGGPRKVNSLGENGKILSNDCWTRFLYLLRRFTCGQCSFFLTWIPEACNVADIYWICDVEHWPVVFYYALYFYRRVLAIV